MGASLKIDFPFGRRTAFRSIREIRVLKIASPNYLPSVDDRWFVIPNYLCRFFLIRLSSAKKDEYIKEEEKKDGYHIFFLSLQSIRLL